MKVLQNIYNCCIKYLSKHTGVATFLSHGGVHFIVLIILVIFAIILYSQTFENETTNMKHIQIDAYEDSDSLNEMLYFPRIINGDIDLDNNKNGKDTISFNLHFFRADQIVDEYDFSLPDSTLAKTNVSMIYEIKTNCEKIGPIIKDSGKNKLSYEELNNKNRLIYKVSSGKSVLNLKECSVPFNFSIFQKPSNSPTTILFLELNLESNTFEPIPELALVGNSHFTSSYFRINYGHLSTESNGNEEYKPFDVKYVFPEPDIVTPFYLEYKNSESVQRIIDNNGIYLIYEDVVAKNKANRISLQFSILIGAIIAFMLDIIVNLIIKWRRLSKNNKKTTSNEKKNEEPKVDEKQEKGVNDE